MINNNFFLDTHSFLKKIAIDIIIPNIGKLSKNEEFFLPLLCQAASLRFLLTRLYGFCTVITLGRFLFLEISKNFERP